MHSLLHSPLAPSSVPPRRLRGSRFTGRPALERLLSVIGVLALLIAGLVSPLLVSFSLSHAPTLPAIGLALVGILGAVLVCRFLWPDRPGSRGALAIAGGLALAFVAVHVGFLAAYLVNVSQGLCGASFENVPPVAGVVAYLAVGGWSFLRPRRLVLGWPVAVLVGVGVMVAVHAGLPGAHGYCET